MNRLLTLKQRATFKSEGHYKTLKELQHALNINKKGNRTDGRSKRKEYNGSDTTDKLRKHDRRSRPIPFFLAAVSVCDIQTFTENRFAKKGADRNKETDRKAVT